MDTLHRWNLVGGKTFAGDSFPGHVPVGSILETNEDMIALPVAMPGAMIYLITKRSCEVLGRGNDRILSSRGSPGGHRQGPGNVGQYFCRTKGFWQLRDEMAKEDFVLLKQPVICDCAYCQGKIRQLAGIDMEMMATVLGCERCR